MSPTLLLPRAARRRITRAAERAAPVEACGLLLGAGAGRDARVRYATVHGNRAADPARSFALDPGVVVAVHARARAARLDVLGAWHAHPGGQAVPSAVDLLEAWPGAVLLIAALRDGRMAGARAWRSLGARAVEELALVPAAGVPKAFPGVQIRASGRRREDTVPVASP